VTLNPATYSGLEHEVGGLAPGRFADIAVIENLELCQVREVLLGGKIFARQGMVEPGVRQPLDFPAGMMHSLALEPAITPVSFKITAPSATPKIRAMELVNQTITAERLLQVNSAGGNVEANLDGDILKVAVFDRRHQSRQVAFGFIKGFGAKIGAVGLTVNLDENALMIVGSDDHDMALCANLLLEAGGGLSIVTDREVIDRLDLPCGGIFSLSPWQDVGRRLRRIQNRIKEMGSPFDKPIFVLSFLSFVTLPALRITARGLVNVKERKIVPLFAD
jgi:adenine deaminase